MDFGAGAGAVGALGNQGAHVDVMSWYVVLNQRFVWSSRAFL